MALWPPDASEPASCPRQAQSRTVPAAGAPLQRHRGCRHDRPAHVRGAGRHCRGLHPEAAPRAALLRAPISSEGRSGWSLGLELRAGNVHSSTGAWDFLERILAKPPTSIAATRTRVRLDGAFYDRDIAQPLDRERLGYVIVARMTQPLRKTMVAARYHEFAHGWEAAEFPYTPFRWNEPHRFVAVRRPSALEPEDIQQRLFTFKHYTYHRALVTNLELTQPPVWRFYCDRGFQELLLREFKGSYAMAKIPTRSFWANAAYMELILWAYDLVLAFQCLCLPGEVQHWNISTLRRELWWLPAEWVRWDNRNLLLARYPRQDLFLRIQEATSSVSPLI